MLGLLLPWPDGLEGGGVLFAHMRLRGGEGGLMPSGKEVEGDCHIQTRLHPKTSLGPKAWFCLQCFCNILVDLFRMNKMAKIIISPFLLL